MYFSVLDEADRILDESFEDQIKEIVKGCSRNRQTMLFSATMSEQVRDLAVVSLKDPVKVFVDSSLGVAQNLRQEFIKVRPPMEQYREAMLVALLVRNFTSRVIVFVHTKLLARRLHILLGLFGLSVGELHGNIPQTIRLDTLNRFKDGKFEVLVATDVASRGLDIKGVRTVVNYSMPKLYKQYIHRVGRTARAGKSGVSVTFYGERDRKIMKDVLRYSRTILKNRSLPSQVTQFYFETLNKMEEDIEAINTHEDANADIYKLEARIKKAEATLSQHEAIYGASGDSKSLPYSLNTSNQKAESGRSWFQTHKERMEKKLSSKIAEFAQCVDDKPSTQNEKKLSRRAKLRKEEKEKEARKKQKLMRLHRADAKKFRKLKPN